MYRGGEKGFRQVVDVADYYLCAIYDFLWGERLYKIATKIHSEKRLMNWHEKIAYTLGDYLPPRIMPPPHFFMKIFYRRIRSLEKELFEKTEGHKC